MITNNNRIEGKKPSGLMLSPQLKIVGHQTRNCKNKGPTTRSNMQPVTVTCHAYGEKGHYRNQCPKANYSAYGRAYLLRDKNAHQDPNVVTDTGSYYPKRYWELLPKEILGATTQRDTGMSYGKMVGLLLIFYGCYGSVRIPFEGKRGVVWDDLNVCVGSCIYRVELPLVAKKTWRLRLGSVDSLPSLQKSRLEDLAECRSDYYDFDEDLTDEDGDTGMGDSTGVSVSLGGEISHENPRESNNW
ncbi:hypothetical protein Tco_1013732 [Tanacetum coccineum]